jgi:phenylacetate-CoA ligase
MGVAEHLYNASPEWLQTVLLNGYALRIRQHRFGDRYARAVAEIMGLERASASAIRAYQDQRLRLVVATAYARTSYYREAFDRLRIKPTEIEGVADLARIPLLYKDAVRDQGSQLLSAPPPQPGWLHGHTSGTTGSPLSLWYDRSTCVFTNAADRQQKIWAGASHRDWIGLFLGRVIVPTERRRGHYWRTNYLQRQVWFSSFHLSDETLPKYVEKIRQQRLRFLEGYPSTMYIVARHILQAGQSVPLKAVFTSSETLHPVQRDTIERAFAAPVFDYYGMAERVVFASECEHHNGKHLCEAYGVTEIVDAEGNPLPEGEVGFVVGTSLHNTAMPMLRYRTSDMSAIEPEPCACGRSFRRLRNITTKAEDIVVLPGGRMISPSILTHPFKPFDDIVTSQIVQESINEVHVRVVARPFFTAEREAQLLAALRERLGPDVHVTLERVSAIPREPSGKFRWVISKVPHSLKVSWGA